MISSLFLFNLNFKMLRPSQLAVLNMILAAKENQTKNPTFARILNSYVQDFLNSKNATILEELWFLTDQNYLTQKGNLTPKGEAVTVQNPFNMSNKEVSKRSNILLYESLKRGLFRDSITFWSKETLSQVLDNVLTEVFERQMKDSFEISEDAAAFIENFKEQLFPTPQNVIVEEQVISAIEVPAEKEKKKRKKKVEAE